MNFVEVQELLAGYADARSPDEIAALCRRFADGLGFDAFIYAYRLPTSFAASEVVQIRGYPDGWLERYWERGYYTLDPVIAYCSHHVLPMAWEDLLPRSSPASRRMMDEAGEFGLRSGISMPMHGPHGELGILSFAQSRSGRRARAAVEHARPLVQLLAGHVHEAVRRVTGVSDGGPPPRLSAREQDCLRWASDGKTSWEIAAILGISERTVNFHVDNAVSKLKAVNRQHALAKAIALRAITRRPF